MWFCTGFRDERFVFPVFEYHGNRALRVIEIAEIHAFGRTGRHAGGKHSFFHAVKAEGALVHVPFGVRITRIIWARTDTGSATDTLVVRHGNNPTLLIMAGAGRATTHAW